MTIDSVVRRLVAVVTCLVVLAGLVVGASWMRLRPNYRVVEGNDGRTYVVYPPSPEGWPAGKGVYAEFDVPSESLKPAGQPNYRVIPGPNVTTGLYGAPPESMPPAGNIEEVMSR